MKKRQVVSIALASAMAASMGLSAAAATDVALHQKRLTEMVDLMHSVLQSLTGKQLIQTSH